MPLGAPPHANDGDIDAPSQVNSTGIAPPFTMAELVRVKAAETGALVAASEPAVVVVLDSTVVDSLHPHAASVSATNRAAARLNRLLRTGPSGPRTVR